MEVQERVRRLREAGRVKRCHTIDILGGEYRVGQHSWDAVNLLLCLNPDASFNLVKAVLWHDGGERWVGDMPAPAKWLLPELSRELQTLEDRVLNGMGCNPGLTKEELEWLNIVDKLEFWLFALDQIALGNRNGETMKANVEAYFNRIALPGVVRQFLATYTWSRTSDKLVV